MDIKSVTQDQEQVLSLTAAAAAQVKTILAREPGATGKALRVSVEGGGCSGMQYGMTFDTPREGDLAAEYYGVTVLVDAASANYLRGTVVDYSDTLMGGGFKISNPNARQSCGCGKSFDA